MLQDNNQFGKSGAVDWKDAAVTAARQQRDLFAPPFKEGGTQLRILGQSYERWVKRAQDDTGKVSFQKLAPTDNNAQKEYIFAAIVRETGGIKIFTIRHQIKNMIAALVTSNQWGHPEGYDVIINRTGQGLQTRYSVVPIAPTPLTTDELALKEQFFGEVDLNDYL